MDTYKYLEAIENEQHATTKRNLYNIELWYEQLKLISKNISDQKSFIHCIIKYIEHGISFVAFTEGLRKRILICRHFIETIGDMICEDLHNIFLEEATQKIFEIIIEEDVSSWCIKKALLMVFNNSTQNVNRKKLLAKLPDIYLFKLIDIISSLGDYDFQVTLVETIYRIYGRKIIRDCFKDLIPESQQISESLANIQPENFDEDVRIFLNKLNKDSARIFSFTCVKLLLGDTECLNPMENKNGLWIDINLKDLVMSWYCPKCSFNIGNPENSIENVGWNLITLLMSDIENVIIHRKEDNYHVMICFTLKAACLSSDEDIQAILNTTLSLILLLEDNELTNELLDTILPNIFGKRFTSSKKGLSNKVSKSSRHQYQPLNVKVNKSKSLESKSSVSLTSNLFDITAMKSDTNSTSKIVTSPPKNSNEVISIHSSLSSKLMNGRNDVIHILSGRCSKSYSQNNPNDVKCSKFNVTQKASKFSYNESAHSSTDNFYSAEALIHSTKIDEKKISSEDEIFETAEMPAVNINSLEVNVGAISFNNNNLPSSLIFEKTSIFSNDVICHELPELSKEEYLNLENKNINEKFETSTNFADLTNNNISSVEEHSDSNREINTTKSSKSSRFNKNNCSQNLYTPDNIIKERKMLRTSKYHENKEKNGSDIKNQTEKSITNKETCIIDKISVFNNQNENIQKTEDAVNIKLVAEQIPQPKDSKFKRKRKYEEPKIGEIKEQNGSYIENKITEEICNQNKTTFDNKSKDNGNNGQTSFDINKEEMKKMMNKEIHALEKVIVSKKQDENKTKEKYDDVNIKLDVELMPQENILEVEKTKVSGGKFRKFKLDVTKVQSGRYVENEVNKNIYDLNQTTFNNKSKGNENNEQTDFEISHEKPKSMMYKEIHVLEKCIISNKQDEYKIKEIHDGVNTKLDVQQNITFSRKKKFRKSKLNKTKKQLASDFQKLDVEQISKENILKVKDTKFRGRKFRKSKLDDTQAQIDSGINNEMDNVTNIYTHLRNEHVLRESTLELNTDICDKKADFNQEIREVDDAKKSEVNQMLIGNIFRKDKSFISSEDILKQKQGTKFEKTGSCQVDAFINNLENMENVKHQSDLINISTESRDSMVVKRKKNQIISSESESLETNENIIRSNAIENICEQPEPDIKNNLITKDNVNLAERKKSLIIVLKNEDFSRFNIKPLDKEQKLQVSDIQFHKNIMQSNLSVSKKVDDFSHKTSFDDLIKKRVKEISANQSSTPDLNEIIQLTEDELSCAQKFNTSDKKQNKNINITSYQLFENLENNDKHTGKELLDNDKHTGKELLDNDKQDVKKCDQKSSKRLFKEIQNIDITQYDNQLDLTTKDCNQTISTTVNDRKKRKLYNPGDLTFMETIGLQTKTVLSPASTVEIVKYNDKLQTSQSNLNEQKFKSAHNENIVKSKEDLSKLELKSGRTPKLSMVTVKPGIKSSNDVYPNVENNLNISIKQTKVMKATKAKSRKSKKRDKIHEIGYRDIKNFTKSNQESFKEPRELKHNYHRSKFTHFEDMLESFREKFGGTHFYDEDDKKLQVKKTRIPKNVKPRQKSPYKSNKSYLNRLIENDRHQNISDSSSPSFNGPEGNNDVSLLKMNNRYPNEELNKIKITSNILINPKRNLIETTEKLNNGKTNDENVTSNITSRNTEPVCFAVVSEPAPLWETLALLNNEFVWMKSDSFLEKYLVLFFYPLDFGFYPYVAAPIEIEAFNNRIDKFEELNTAVIGCSVDSCYTHLSWLKMKQEKENFGSLKFPLISDSNHIISKSFHMYAEKWGHTLRGFCIINPEGILVQNSVFDVPYCVDVERVIEQLKKIM